MNGIIALIVFLVLDWIFMNFCEFDLKGEFEIPLEENSSECKNVVWSFKKTK